MPMKPADADSRPPMAKPIAVRKSRMKISATKSGIATTAIVVYWRFRYARAPICTAPEIRCISALPGDSASSARDVVAPYATARPAHSRAMTTPWSVSNELKDFLRIWVSGPHGTPGEGGDPGQERAQDIGPCGATPSSQALLTRNPELPAGLSRTLSRLGLVAWTRLAGAWRGARPGDARVGELELGER